MKKIITGQDARMAIKRGIDTVADIVKVTLGPKGSNVLLGSQYAYPTITNDGVSIAKDIELEDVFENQGVLLIKEVAERTNESAGDGTTTSTILTQKLVSDGLKYIETGMNPVGIREGMEEAKNVVVGLLKKNAKEVKSLAEATQVATISVESNEIGKLVAETIFKVGKEGAVTIEDSSKIGITSEVVEGMSFDRGFISPHFTEDGKKVELNNPAIIITTEAITNFSSIIQLISSLAEKDRKDILLISENLDGDALANILVNNAKKKLNIIGVRCPDFGDRRNQLLDDIAYLTGAVVISKDKGMTVQRATSSMVGVAKRVIVTKDRTTILSTAKESYIEKQRKLVRSLISKTKSEYEKDFLKSRLGRLSSGVGIIKVGASSETEQTYLKHKIEDAIAATQSALEEGIVQGGGIALLNASILSEKSVKKSIHGQTDDFIAGYKTVINALVSPFEQIIKNTGRSDASAILAALNKMPVNAGFNAKENRIEDDMFSAGIVDPLKVTRLALENSVSVASIFLTTEAVIVAVPQEMKII